MAHPAPNVGSPAARRLRSNQTALLVIHGIGEQNPYETLDNFARGMFWFLGDECHLDARLQPKEIAHKDWTQVYMRIGVGPFVKDQPEGYVDVYEYYWAPFTEDKLSVVETLKWLIRTDLTPLRYLGDNLQEMMDSQSARTLRQALYFFLREIRRIVLLYLPVVAGLLYLLTWLSRTPSLKGVLRPLTFVLSGDPWWARPAALACYAVALLMVFFCLQTLASLAKRKGQSIERRAELLWSALAIVFAGLFFWFGGKVSAWKGGPIVAIWLAFVDLVIWFVETVLAWMGMSFTAARSATTREYLPLVAAIAGLALSYVLTKYVADVAIYVTADAKSKNYAARSAILDGSTKALSEILVNPDYDRVILAGHSLGSVIAYDTINEMIGRVSGMPGPGPDHPEPPVTQEQLGKLRGLVTFGSPLDKIYYFFRQHVKEDQAIRAQILSLLHSFRKVPSGRDYGKYKFRYGPLKLEGLIWLNAWSPLDPVSAYLYFYQVDQQQSFWYSVPGLAHLGYCTDPDFYEFWGRALVVQ